MLDYCLGFVFVINAAAHEGMFRGKLVTRN